MTNTATTSQSASGTAGHGQAGRAVAPGACRPVRPGALLAIVLTGQLMAVIDVFIVNIGLPTIHRHLHASGASLQLVVAGYTIAYAVLLDGRGRIVVQDDLTISGHPEISVHGDMMSLRGLPNVLDIRTVGLTAGIDLAPRPDLPGKRGFDGLNSAFHDNDLMLRVAGDTLALTPPLIVTEDQIGEIVDKVAKVIRAVA